MTQPTNRQLLEREKSLSAFFLLSEILLINCFSTSDCLSSVLGLSVVIDCLFCSSSFIKRLCKVWVESSVSNMKFLERANNVKRTRITTVMPCTLLKLLSKVNVDTLGSSIIDVNTPKDVDIAINIYNNSITFLSLESFCLFINVN